MSDNLAVVLIIAIVVIYQLIKYCADAYVNVKIAEGVSNANSQKEETDQEA